MIDPIANVVDLWDECLRDVGNKCVHFPGIHDIDWLSGENIDITPWHYTRYVGIAFWDVRKIYIPFPMWIRYYNSLKFADFLLSDSYDDKEGY